MESDITVEKYTRWASATKRTYASRTMVYHDKIIRLRFDAYINGVLEIRTGEEVLYAGTNIEDAIKAYSLIIKLETKGETNETE